MIRIDVVQPAGRQHALHNADMLDARFGPTEQPVLSAHRDDPKGALDMIRVDRCLWII
jgi:hypothetical protein